MAVPSDTTGTCIGPVPGRYAVMVLVDGSPAAGGLECDVGTDGPRDAQRGDYPPLPTPGTRGLISFPRGDLRSGVWVRSIRGPLLDVNHGIDGKGHFASSSAMPSGTCQYHSETGQFALVFPDGTEVLVGYATPPVLTRHTLGANQAPITVPFAQSQRVKTAPSAFPLLVKSSGGASVSLPIDGSAVVTSAGNAILTLAADGHAVLTSTGGATVTVAVDGSVTVHAASGKLVTVSSGGTAQAVRLADGTASTVLRAQ